MREDTTPSEVPSPHSYRVQDGHGLRHNPLKAMIAPRPIAWISTLSKTGVPNLAPYSFFNMINDDPPQLMFASSGYKDTVTNIAETREFVVNLADRRLAEALNATSRPFPPNVSEFDEAKLDSSPSMLVAPRRVTASPAALECRRVQIIPVPDLDGNSTNSWLTIGQIVAVHIDLRCIVDGMYRTEAAAPITRAGYTGDYWEIGGAGKFQMPRPAS